jgi:hypothetical protein
VNELEIADGELLPVAHRDSSRDRGYPDFPARAAADYWLSPETVEALKEAIPAETYRKYMAWQERAAQWCAIENRTLVPMTTQTLTEWVRVLTETIAERTGQPYSASALGQAVAAVLALHTWAQIPDSLHPHPKPARALIKAHKRRLAQAGRRVTRSAVVDTNGFAAMVSQCDTSTLTGLRDRLICIWSIWAMTRRSEFTARVFHDAVVIPSKGVRLYFAASKTDQAAEGEWVSMPARDDALDPVTAYTEYRDGLAERCITTGPILRRIDRWGNIGDALAAESVNDICQKIADAAGVAWDDEGRKLTAHGLRASGATIADENGASGAAIRKQGRWSLNSKVADGYIRPRDEWSGNAMAKVPVIPAPRTSEN